MTPSNFFESSLARRLSPALISARCLVSLCARTVVQVIGNKYESYSKMLLEDVEPG